MITYDQGDYHLGFIFQKDGSTLPKAACFALPSVTLAMTCRFLLQYSNVDLKIWGPQSTLVWSVTFFTLSMLVGFRCNKAFARFWDGCELVQAMSAEWFESCSNLIAFSLMPLKQNPGDESKAQKVQSFQFRLVHLMSLLHGVALRQVGGEDGDDIEVLDVFGLDEASLTYLREACSEMEINRVEVILHWIQVLITESIYEGVLIVPPPILTRAYQTLSRGMVNLHNVRRIADIPFPFPLAQATVVLLIVHSIITPIMVSFFFVNYGWCALVTFMPIFGCWNIVFVCGEMEQPFGNDDNDLPLSMQQFEFHTSLMMLVDDRSMIVPTLTEDAASTVETLRERFGNEESSTAVLYPEEMEETETMREALRAGQKQRSTRRALFDVDVEGHPHEDAGDEESVHSDKGFVGKVWTKMFGGKQTQHKKTTAMVKLMRANSMASSASGGTPMRMSTYTNYETASQGGSRAASRQVSKDVAARSTSKASTGSKAIAAKASRKSTNTVANVSEGAPPHESTVVGNGPSNVAATAKSETIVTLGAHAIEVTQMQWQALPEPLPLPEPLGLSDTSDASALRPPKTPLPPRASSRSHGRSRSHDTPPPMPRGQHGCGSAGGGIQNMTDVAHLGKRTMSWPPTPLAEDVVICTYSGHAGFAESEGWGEEGPIPCMSAQPTALPQPRTEPWSAPDEGPHVNGVDARHSNFGGATQHVYEHFRGLMGYDGTEGADIVTPHAEKLAGRV